MKYCQDCKAILGKAEPPPQESWEEEVEKLKHIIIGKFSPEETEIVANTRAKEACSQLLSEIREKMPEEKTVMKLVTKNPIKYEYEEGYNQYRSEVLSILNKYETK